MSGQTKPTAGTIVWGELMTPELEKARAFYGELLGWSFQASEDQQTGFYTTAMRGDAKIVGLFKQGPDMPGPSAWCCYFASDDVDETAKKIAAAGGSLLLEPMDVMQYGRMAMCADPSGAVFGVWQSKEHAGSDLFNEPGAMCWHEVYSRDAGKVLDFYARVFDLTQQKMEGDLEYWTLHKGEQTVGGVMQMTDQFPKEVPSHWNVYFAVSDADAAAKKLERLGGTVRQPAFDTPFGRMAAVSDHAGAAFCIIKLA